MVETLAREGRIVASLRQNEPALNDGLGVSREAVRSPVTGYAAIPPRSLDIGLKRRGMAKDTLATGIANFWRSYMNLLRHRSDEAGEFCQFAFDDRLPESDIRKDAVERISWNVVGRGLKKRGRGFSPKLGCRNAKGFFVFEVMKECSLRYTGNPTQVIDCRRSESLCTNDVPRRLKKPSPCIAAFWCLFGWSGHDGNIPYGWYVSTTCLWCSQLQKRAFIKLRRKTVMGSKPPLGILCQTADTSQDCCL